MIDCEVAGYVQRVLQGIRVNDYTTDLSHFKEVGPGGTFIDRMHTHENFKKEMWLPAITSRGVLDIASDPSLTGMRSNAKEAITKALQAYTPPSLPEDIDSRLEAIIHE